MADEQGKVTVPVGAPMEGTLEDRGVIGALAARVAALEEGHSKVDELIEAAWQEEVNQRLTNLEDDTGLIDTLLETFIKGSKEIQLLNLAAELRTARRSARGWEEEARRQAKDYSEYMERWRTVMVWIRQLNEHCQDLTVRLRGLKQIVPDHPKESWNTDHHWAQQIFDDRPDG